MTSVVSHIATLLENSLSISSSTANNPLPASLPTTTGVSDSKALTQPDIEYHPNEEKWKARTARRLAEDHTLLQTPLPTGFPHKLESPLVWDERDWKDPQQWEYQLTIAQLKEIDDAVKHFNGKYVTKNCEIHFGLISFILGLGKPFGHISPDTFPLPTLGPILRDLSKELHTGRGFFVLRTIPVDNYSREDNILLYAGVSSYIGSRRGIQDRGDGSHTVLGHIKDLRETHSVKTIGAPAFTADKQVFHTDAGDIISLFVLQTAVEGGTSRIGSSWRVYNELAETRPDLIKTLSEPSGWVIDT